MTRCTLKFALLVMLATYAPCVAVPAQNVAGQYNSPHVSRGLQAGAQDFPVLSRYLCSPPRPRAISGVDVPPPPRRIPAGKAFDNLYFVGHAKASAWVIETKAGLILIDALDSPAEAQDYIESGMRSLGLDPGQIKVMIVTHYHKDHTGGAAYIASKYHPQVVMGDADWKALADLQKDLPASDRLERDRSIQQNESLTLGDTKVDIYMTPGHTEGTLSLIFPVREGARSRLAVLWGGTDIRQDYMAYARSAALMKGQVQRRGVDVFLSNHASADDTEVKLARLASGATQINPFVTSVSRTRRAFDMFHECALARADY